MLVAEHSGSLIDRVELIRGLCTIDAAHTFLCSLPGLVRMPTLLVSSRGMDCTRRGSGTSATRGIDEPHHVFIVDTSTYWFSHAVSMRTDGLPHECHALPPGESIRAVPSLRHHRMFFEHTP